MQQPLPSIVLVLAVQRHCKKSMSACHPTEANGTYETLLSMLNKDGRLPLKAVHGYLDILRRERPIPADVDPQKFLDFSMLPGGK